MVPFKRYRIQSEIAIEYQNLMAAVEGVDGRFAEGLVLVTLDRGILHLAEDHRDQVLSLQK